MASRLRALLLVTLLAAPTPLLAQTTVLGDTVWAAQSADAVGRAITVRFAERVDRSARLAEDIALPMADGRQWQVQDIVLSLDVGVRAPDLTWRVVGPATVIDAFEAELRRKAAARPTVQAVEARPLVVR